MKFKDQTVTFKKIEANEIMKYKKKIFDEIWNKFRLLDLLQK